MNTQIVLMDEEEARWCISQIHNHLESTRQLLFELYNREGWRALGYQSWSDCVQAEFGKSRSYLYRELAAARLEDGVGMDIGVMPESHARAVISVMGDDEDGAAMVVSTVNSQISNPSADDYKKAALEVWVQSNMGGTDLERRMTQGIVSPSDAYRIGNTILGGRNPDELMPVLTRVTDPDLAGDLLIIREALPDMWNEVRRTGAIQYDGESVQLEDATYTMLRAWVTLDNAEARAIHVENNRERYDGRRELTGYIINQTERLCWLIHNGGDTETILTLSEKIHHSIQELREI